MKGKIIGQDFQSILQHPPVPKAHESIHLILGQRALDSICTVIADLVEEQREIIRSKHVALFLVANENEDLPRSVQVSAGSKQNYFSSLDSDVVTTVINASISPSNFGDLIDCAATDENVAAIIVQMPIPVSYRDMLLRIPLSKDIDALNPTNPEVCATAYGICRLIEMYYVPGRDTILLNGYRGFLGKQVGQGLNARGLEWSGHEIDSQDAFEEKIANATIVVTAVGKPGLLPVDYFNGQKLVVDAGYGFFENGTLSGDVDSTLYRSHGRVHHITPVPCGCGPLEMAILLERFMCICLKTICSPPKVDYCTCV